MNRKYKEAFIKVLRGQEPFADYWSEWEGYAKDIFLDYAMLFWADEGYEVRDMLENANDEEFFEYLVGEEYQYMDFNGDGFPELLIRTNAYYPKIDLLMYEPEEDRVYHIRGFYGDAYYFSPGQEFYCDITRDRYSYTSYDEYYNVIDSFTLKIPGMELQDELSICSIEMCGDFPAMYFSMENIDVLAGFFNTMDTISSFEWLSFEDVFMEVLK